MNRIYLSGPMTGYGKNMTAAIDIKKFCGHRGHSLQHLIRCTHGIVATDGSILICVPDDGREAAEDEKQITHAVNKWKMEIENANRKWHDMCNINLPAPLPCEFCSGNGYNFALACLDCEGDGAFEHGNHWYECKECDGDGELRSITPLKDYVQTECSKCNGSGERFQSVKTFGSKFQVQKLCILQRVKKMRKH